MSSAENKASRMPEIEHIALREAFRDLGVDTQSSERDIFVRIERGAEGFRVAEAINPEGGAFAANNSARFRLRFDADSVSTSSEGALANDAIETLCRDDPEAALDLAIDSLGRSADMMTEIVEETRRDLIEFEIRRRRIDRAQAQTREILEDLIEGR